MRFDVWSYYSVDRPPVKFHRIWSLFDSTTDNYSDNIVGLNVGRFRSPETVAGKTDYIAAIVIRWGIKRTPNAMKLGRRPTHNIITPHSNFQPIPRTFLCHL